MPLAVPQRKAATTVVKLGGSIRAWEVMHRVVVE